jgi:predicted membrane metal-binding protein
MAVSAAAWLSSAPLTAVFFGWFIPITLPANLIIVPVSSLVLLAACLSVVLGSCVAFVADVFNHANLALVSLLVWVADRLASLPGSQVRVDRPSLAALFGVYAAVGAAGLVGWIALAWSEESKGVCTSAPVADSVQRL